MYTLDELLKQSAPKKSPGATSVENKTTSFNNVDDLLNASKPKPGYVPPTTTKRVEPVIEPTKNRSFVSKMFKKTTDAIADTPYFKKVGEGLALSDQESIAEKILKPASFGFTNPENIPLGVGEVIRQGKSYIKNIEGPNVTFVDWLNGMKQAGQGFAGQIVSGATELPSIVTAGAYRPEIKFNFPGIGEVSNSDYKIADRVIKGEDPNVAVLQEKASGFLNALFFIGLATKPFVSRPVTTNKIITDSAPGGITAPKMKSFQLYNEPKYVTPLSPDFINKIKSQGVDLGKDFNPSLPTYFKMVGNPKGKIVSEVIQIKPSYFNVLKSKFSGDITKVPPEGIKVLNSKTTDVNKAETYYHGANAETVANIKKNGFIGSKDFPGNGMVSLTTDKAGAHIYVGKNGEVLSVNIKGNKVKTYNSMEEYTNAIESSKGATAGAKETLLNSPYDKVVIKNAAADGSSLILAKPNAVSIVKEASGALPPKVPVIPPPIKIPTIPIEEIKYKVEQILPAIKDDPTDEHLITTAKTLAEESGDTSLIKKVNEAIAIAEENAKKTEEVSQKIDQILEEGQITPEKQLTEPAYTPYKPARAIPAERVYNPTGRFITGEYDGKPYTTDSFILEFNSDVQPPKRAEVFSGKDGDNRVPTEEAINRIIPDQTEAVKTEIVKVHSSEDGKQNFVTLEGDGVKVEMQQKYYDYFNRKYPNSVFMAVEPMKPVVVKSKGEMVGLIMPTTPGGVKTKTVWEKPKVVQSKLSDVKKEVQTPAQKKIKELERENKKLKESKNEELANLASPQGNKTINKIVERQAAAKVSDVQEVPADFKISERAKAILADFGIPVGEKSLSNRLLGVYKPLTQKVRVQALYDVTTVTHEAIHAIDDQIKFSETLIKETGKGAEIRKRLTDIYEELYPRAKRTHKLDTRIKEGLAVLFENYFYDPASITAKYPDLVDGFIKPEGKYYTPQFTKLLDAMNSLVEDYAKLSPEQRIGSRIRTGKEVVEKKTGFTAKQRTVYELFNRFEPLKRYGEEAGVAGTWDDPYVQAFNIMNKNSIITNWVKNEGRVTFMKDGKKVQMESGHRAVLLRDGNWRIEKGSIADYLKLVDGDEKAFRSYLVARRVNEEYNKLNDLMNTANKTPEIRDEINKLSKIIQRDDFSLQDASAVVEKYEEKFAEATAIYDDINRSLVDFAEENDMITSEAAKTYREEKGYTSFKRFIDEELQALGTVKTSSNSKVTSFKERTGSQLDIIDPVYSQITSINEIVSKALENRLWNKVADLTKDNPEISQRFERMSATPSIDAEGNISFPQEKDPGIIRIFRKGKREFYKIAPEFGAVAKQLRGKEFDLFVQLLRVPASVFTRFTTSANPMFAVGNLAVDQFTATAQTKAGFIPVADPAKSFVKYFSGDEGMSAYIAMGGKRQSLASFYDLAPEDVAHKLTGGQTTFEKGVDVLDSALGVLEMPSNLSEITTRFSEYDRLVKEGFPMSVAMFQASDVTTPFQLQGNMGGRLGQEYIKAIPYLNAIIQVNYKSYRAGFKDDPKRYWTTTAGVMAAGLTTAILIYSNASEKQKRLLGEQPVRNNSQYIYLPSLDGESLWRLKVPQQMGIWHGMASLYVAQNYKGNEATFSDYVDVVSTAIPEQVQFWEPTKALLSWIPQVGKPSIQVAANFKTFPNLGPIVPPYMVDQAPEKQYNAYTSEVSKTVGGILGISPAKTDFWIKNQFGVVGNLFLLKTPQNPINIQEKDYVMTGRSYNRFYENRTIVENQYAEIVTDDKGDNPKYSYEDKYTIKEERSVYTKVSELLTEMRNINKTTDLPEGIKSSAYELLLKIDSSENIQDVVPDIYRLEDEIFKVKDAQPMSKKEDNKILATIKDVFGTKTAEAAVVPEEMRDAYIKELNSVKFNSGNKTLNLDEIKKQVAYRESRSSKDPYTAVNKANKNGTADYGKYQVNSTTLKENSQRFLGQDITPEEFLKRPDLQEKFFEQTMKHFKDNLNVKNLDTALTLWHRGFGDISSARIQALKKNPEVIAYLGTKPKE